MVPRPVLKMRGCLLKCREVSAQAGDPELIRDVREDSHRADEREHEGQPVFCPIRHAHLITKNGATQNTQESRMLSRKVASAFALSPAAARFSRPPRHGSTPGLNGQGQVDFPTRKMK